MLTTGAVAESVFNGRYTDPNHPDGFRVVNITDTVDPITGRAVGLVVGSDTSSTQLEFTLPAYAKRVQDTDYIYIDFTPKGGPKDLQG